MRRRISILIVDDEQSYLETITSILEGNDYRILQAINGDMGFKVAVRRKPDVIIMDWDMPILDGIEAIKKLKSNNQTRYIPVIMSTGIMTSSENLEKALDAGAIDYIRKPIDEIELKARLHSVLNISKFYNELMRKNEELEDLSREKDSLMSIVAHDLKSPLAQISNLADVISWTGDLNQEQSQSLELMQKVAESGIGLINDLLDLQRLEQKGSPIVLDEINLGQWLKDSLDPHMVMARSKSVKVSIQADNFLIKSDRRILKRILDNLLSNALKHTPEQGSIEVSCGLKDGRYFIKVKDSGNGIAEENHKRIFKKFESLGQSDGGGSSSHGLGLAIVKLLTEQLKGEVMLESAVGEGAAFEVRLPIV